ncbi:gfo/Idh/MocA family oxidoreductase protein [Halorubrum sp. AJ67]|nr:gfo/Idh/MocA family oxidoreductase protein [Halorubrum sp. AJ67]
MNGHRVEKTQPDGGSRGLGGDPRSVIRSCVSSGSGCGIADSSARV